MGKKLINEMAEDIKMIMIQIDLFGMKYKTEDIEKIISNMKTTNSNLEAWPMPETMRKAEIMKAQVRTFSKLYELLKVRAEQLKIQKSSELTAGQTVLKAMGLSD